MDQIQKNEMGYLMKYKDSWKVYQIWLKIWPNKWALNEIRR
jgi:hypothetical protein